MNVTVTKRPSNPIYHNEILGYRVVDGDTIHAVIDLGYECYKTVTIRLLGINTPETKSNNPLEKEAGSLSKQVASRLLEMCWDKRVDLESFKLDMYGRPLGKIYMFSIWRELNSVMLKLKVCKSHLGDAARAPWTDEELKEVILNANRFLQDPVKCLLDVEVMPPSGGPTYNKLDVSFNWPLSGGV